MFLSMVIFIAPLELEHPHKDLRQWCLTHSPWLTLMVLDSFLIKTLVLKSYPASHTIVDGVTLLAVDLESVQLVVTTLTVIMVLSLLDSQPQNHQEQ